MVDHDKISSASTYTKDCFINTILRRCSAYNFFSKFTEYPSCVPTVCYFYKQWKMFMVQIIRKGPWKVAKFLLQSKYILIEPALLIGPKLNILCVLERGFCQFSSTL